MIIDLEEKVNGCDFIYWKEVLLLPKWGFHAYPTPQQYTNLIHVCMRADWIRKYFNIPIQITSGLRPSVYNAFIKGARKSMHREGRALDFIIKGLKSDDVRAQLIPLLDRLDLRMEDLPGSTWVHIDTGYPGKTGRFFKP